jgi:hypothetical protein
MVELFSFGIVRAGRIHAGEWPGVA